MDIVQIAEASAFGVNRVGEVYCAVGEALGLVPLRAAARNLPGGTAWARIARETLVQDSYIMQRRLTQKVLSEGTDLVQWRTRRVLEVEQIDVFLTEMVRANTPDLALLSVVAGRIAALA
jgi:NAD-specific glutamate dehydrogenase